MHRTSAANTATFNTASIMLLSTESRLPLEVLICRRPGKFPAARKMPSDWFVVECPLSGVKWTLLTEAAEAHVTLATDVRTAQQLGSLAILLAIGRASSLVS